MKAKFVKDILNVIKDFYIRNIIKEVESIFKTKMNGPAVKFINDSDDYIIDRSALKTYYNLNELIKVIKAVNRNEKNIIWEVYPGDYLTAASIKFKSVNQKEFEQYAQEFYNKKLGKDPHFKND